MSKIALCTSTLVPGLLENCLAHAADESVLPVVHLNGLAVEESGSRAAAKFGALTTQSPEIIGYPEALDRTWRAAPQDVDTFLFIHDDLLILEPQWANKLSEMIDQRPALQVCGFAGAKGLGARGMYNVPYDLQNLGRSGFHSSLINWADHGHELKTPTRGAMLDGMCFCIKRSFLERINGWGWWPLPHHGYDYAMSCMAARHQAELWLVPIKCEHLSGQTACTDPYQSWAQEKFGGDIEVFKKAHELVFEMFRDVLPLRVS